MKKRIGLYIGLWAILLAVFNVIAFVIPPFFSVEKYTASFWIGYSFITAMMLGQLVCAIIALRADNAKKTFYRLSLLKTSIGGIILSFIIGGICIVIPFAYWIGAVACAIVLAINVFAVVKASIAIDAVEKIDQKIAYQTFFIKAITADADSLMSEAKTDELKAECKKVYEALRYSDPMSNEALVPIEGEISVKFAAFSNAVRANDAAAAADLASAIIILATNRNNKCKLFK